MKAFLILLALFGFAATAATRHVLLYSEFSTGGPGESSYVGIFDDGSLLSWEGQVDAPPASAKVLGKLTPAVIQGLQSRINGIPDSLVLIDPSPYNASCNNTAKSIYAVRKTTGARIPISSTTGCHTSAPGGTSIVDYLIRVIAGVDGFSYMSSN